MLITRIFARNPLFLGISGTRDAPVLLVLDRDLVAVDALVRVGDVQEEVLLMVLLVEAAHRGRGRGNHIVNEKEQRVLGSEADPFSNQEVKLAYRQITGNLQNINNPQLCDLISIAS